MPRIVNILSFRKTWPTLLLPLPLPLPRPLPVPLLVPTATSCGARMLYGLLCFAIPSLAPTAPLSPSPLWHTTVTGRVDVPSVCVRVVVLPASSGGSAASSSLATLRLWAVGGGRWCLSAWLVCACSCSQFASCAPLLAAFGAPRSMQRFCCSSLGVEKC